MELEHSTKNVRRTIMCFVQEWLEVVAIAINNIAAFVRMGKASLNIASYYLTLSKAKQRFRVNRNSNATPTTKPDGISKHQYVLQITIRFINEPIHYYRLMHQKK